MGQLIRANVIPLKTVHYSQPGRLVSSDSVDIERRKAIARHNAMRTNYASTVGANDYRYIQQINQAFNRKQTSVQASSHAASLSSDAVLHQASANVSAKSQAVSHASAPQTTSAPPQVQPRTDVPSESADTAQRISIPGISESQAAYTLQRGSFELRVAKGELSYLPPLEMTIIVQYPSIEFEYLGDFNYVPPHNDEQTETDII